MIKGQFFLQYILYLNKKMSSSEGCQHSEIGFPNPIKNYKIKQYTPDGLISQFSYMLIRPPRFLYNEKLLALNDRKLMKKFKIEKRLIPFQLTLYTVENMEYVILYLHGNSSSRLEGKIHVNNLPEGVGLACFDFNGCGLRNQSFITLGKKESVQVDIAAKYLKSQGYKVVGWGRSMGAVSLLLSQQCDIMVADSPFNSLGDLCKQSSSKFLPVYCCCIFYCFYPCFFQCIRSDVQHKSGLDINELEIGELIKRNPRNKQRCLIVIVGLNDLMIPHEHGMKVFKKFPGKKKIILFDGNHNSERPAHVNSQAFQFIHEHLGIIKSSKSFLSNYQSKIHNRQLSDQTQTTTKQENGIQMQILHKQASIQLLPTLMSESVGSKFKNSLITEKMSQNYGSNVQKVQGSGISCYSGDEKQKERLLAATNIQSTVIADLSIGKQVNEKQKNVIKIFPKNQQGES